MLEEYLVEHLPLSSFIDTFGCELTLIDADTHMTLQDPIQEDPWWNNQFCLIVHECFLTVENNKKLQGLDYEDCPKAIRVPATDSGILEAKAFYSTARTKKWKIVDWKVNVSKPAPIHGEHQSPAQWPHTRIFPGKTKLVLQPRSSTQTYNQEPNNIQQTYTKPTFSRSPKPTNDKQPTNQKEWLSAKYTWNALAQVWSAPFEEAPGLQC